MTLSKHAITACAVLCSLSLTARLARCHGFVGPRFFPATVTTEDPLVADELSLPSISLAYPAGEETESRLVAGSFEFAKVILPRLAVGISDAYFWQKPRGGLALQGWDNLELSAKYEVWRSEPHEAILSIGLEAELGGTGSKSIGRDSFTTFTPTLYFGKGLGDLPDTLAFLKPVAITGTVGLSIPTEAEANAVEWGLALQYNIPYLQQHVKDLGLPAPFKDLIPLVEFTFENPLNRGESQMTGSINPGILWETKYLQVGVEALLPMNRESGSHVGAIMQFEIYIDDLFPAVFGHPIFGE